MTAETHNGLHYRTRSKIRLSSFLVDAAIVVSQKRKNPIGSVFNITPLEALGTDAELAEMLRAKR